MQRVIGVITYDITLTRFRSKLSKLLSGYGERVQFSVFQFELEQKVYEEMMKKLNELYGEYLKFAFMEGDLDHCKRSIRIYFLCKACNSKVIILEGKNKKRSQGMVI